VSRRILHSGRACCGGPGSSATPGRGPEDERVPGQNVGRLVCGLTRPSVVLLLDSFSTGRAADIEHGAVDASEQGNLVGARRELTGARRAVGSGGGRNPLPRALHSVEGLR